MARVLLFHWKEEEARQLLETLESWGHAVGWRGMRVDREVKITGPKKFGAEVVVFDLSRMPVYAKYHAELTRKAKSTAHIPFIFVGGAEDKVAALRKIYPQEVFTDWKKLRGVLRKISLSSVAPRPAPQLEGEAVRQLWQKLGIRSGYKVALFDAPREFFGALGELPEGVEFQEEARGANLVLYFFEDWDSFGQRLEEVAQQGRRCPVWVFYRKGVLKMTEIREALLDMGLVDYKICAVNKDWAGILAREKRV